MVIQERRWYMILSAPVLRNTLKSFNRIVNTVRINAFPVNNTLSAFLVRQSGPTDYLGVKIVRVYVKIGILI